MYEKTETILAKIKCLEADLHRELRRKEEEFFYRVERNRVRFSRDVEARHRRLSSSLHRYLSEASFRNILTVPLIWSLLLSALLLDLMFTLYHAVCFPVYGIPKVKRGDYVVIDRIDLQYLNPIEKLNCVYCSYFNGLIAYVQEIAARTEQYWCPIKHARQQMTYHSRYRHFLDYGDAAGYQDRLAEIRRAFADLEKEEAPDILPGE